MADSQEKQKNTCRLLTFPQELQDMIQELVFTDSFTVDSSGSMHPFLRAIGKKHYHDIYYRAKETYFRNTTFKIRLEHIRPFFKRNKQYLPLIKDIHILPASNADADVFRIPKAMHGTSHGPMLELLWNLLTMSSVRTSVEKHAEVLAALTREAMENGVRKGVIKMLVAIDSENKDVRSMWTSKPVQRLNRYLEIAGYSRVLTARA